MNLVAKHKNLYLSALLVSFGVFVFWRILKYPYVGDDLNFIYLIQHASNIEWLKRMIFEWDYYFRPLSTTYYLLVYRLFGMNSTVAHLINLCLHLSSALLLVYILNVITGEFLLAWLAGFIYATAYTIALDSLLLLVGIEPLAESFFILLSFALFLRHRHRLSAVALMSAVLFRESAVVMPAVFLFYKMLAESDKKVFSIENFKKNICSITPHILLLGAYLALRIIFLSPLNLKQDHPYRMIFSLSHLLRNFAFCNKTSIQTMLTFLPIRSFSKTILVIVNALFGIIIIIFLAKPTKLKNGLFFLFWYLIGLAIFLPFQRIPSEYYLSLSIAPFIFMCLFFVRKVIFSLKWISPYANIIVICFVVMNVLCVFFHIYLEDSKTIEDHYSPGKDTIMMRGKLIKILNHELESSDRKFPKDAVFIFEGINIWAFYKEEGPRLWLRNEDLRVFDINYLTIKQDGIFVVNHPRWFMDAYGINPEPRFKLDFQHTFMMHLKDNRLLIYRLSDFMGEDLRFKLDNLDNYQFKEVIDYKNIKNNAFFSEWYIPEGGWRWSKGKLSEIIFKVKSQSSEGDLLILEISAGAFGKQEINVEVNGSYVGNLQLDGFESKICRLSFKKELINWDGVNKIVFRSETAKAPAVGDNRQIALAFRNLKIYPKIL